MADTRIDQARTLAASGQLRDAMGLLKAVLQGNPQDADARQLLTEVQDNMMLELQIGDTLAKAEALLAENHNDQAQKLLMDVLKVSPGHPRATALLKAVSSPPAHGEDLSATLSMDTFNLESLGPAPAVSPAAKPAQKEPEPFELGSLDSLEPLGSESMEGTVLSASPGALAPAESARIREYLDEGNHLFDEGRYQDAVDIWTKIYILDEGNHEADALIAKAREVISGNQGEIEHILTEAVAAFNAGDLARSRPLLEKVLHSFPGHREALYYLGRVNEGSGAAAPAAASAASPQGAGHSPAPTGGDIKFAAPPPIASTPAAPFGSSFSAGSPDEFEFEDGAGFQAGNQQGSPGASSGGFEFDAPIDDLGFAPLHGGSPSAPAPAGDSATPAPQAPAQPAPEAFNWDPPPEGFGAAQPTAPPGGLGLDAPLPAAIPSKGASKGGKKAKTGGPPWGILIAAALGLILLGGGILVATKFFSGGSGPGPSTVTPGKIPPPKLPRVDPPPTTTQVAPPTTPQLDPKVMSPEDLLKAARAKDAEKDFAKAVSLYQELISRGGSLNTEAVSGLAEARASLLSQQAENQRNEKFIKDYNYAIRAYREGDYQECVRIAWRFIYPDDTLARQLGKRDGAARLIRDGYYNWAVLDLKGENVRGADKNLKDLAEFEKNDPEAVKLQQFMKPYLNNPVDQNFRDVVKGLSYRPLQESP